MNCHNYNRHRCGYACPGGQRGAALIVAMLVFALCTALVVAMKSEFQRFYQRAANVMLAEQAYAYLLGAEELAATALLLDYDQGKGNKQRIRNRFAFLRASLQSTIQKTVRFAQ